LTLALVSTGTLWSELTEWFWLVIDHLGDVDCISFFVELHVVDVLGSIWCEFELAIFNNIPFTIDVLVL
jgi:hypothetical protein